MGIKLTNKDIYDLKKQGYSDEEISKAVQDIETDELEQTENDSPQEINRGEASSFSTGRMDDIARYQLELNDLLEQTEHVLKGDVVKWENGVKIWMPNPKPKDNPLNSEGIRKIMLELQNYINRHIILGDYDNKDINKIMKDYGRKLTNLIFMKYEEMGMDTEIKRQEYGSIVMNVVNLVYGSYARAKDGGERRSLREMISIQGNYQGQAMPNGNMQNSNQSSKTRGVLNPLRYVAGKYV